MNTGMLWFNNDPKMVFSEKVLDASRYYHKKYGTWPDLCFVNPSMVGKETPAVPGVEIRTNRGLLPHHFWIGLKEG